MSDAPRHVAVIDIGKTNAKLALVDLQTLEEVALRRTPNTVLTGDPYPRYDIETLWDFILDSLAQLQREAPIDAISVTTHGATAALLDAEGHLALPVLDYEHTGPDTLRAAYDKVRPSFAESGAPGLPIGLNLGAQLYWQQQTFPAEFARASAIVMYPQYWSYRLSGVLASEMTSLGCHTDLWAPMRRDFSSMVDTLGWRPLFPPVRAAGDRLGPVLPSVIGRTGLADGTPVYCGIHDSNASLLPHLLARPRPFSVVSTGTWVICMSVGGKQVVLDPARDTLINVDAFGNPVPSARFMGGRENAQLGEGLPDPTAADIDAVFATGVMYLPAAVQGSGPFPHTAGRWVNEPTEPGAKRAAISFYLALMAATCLELNGAEGPVVVEGPFAGNAEFTAMLRAATGRGLIAEAASTGTSIGAALLVGRTQSADRIAPVIPAPDPRWSAYAAHWRTAL